MTVRSNSVTALPLLHVDDNPNERLFVRQAILLTKTPFAYYEADSLESAITQFESHRGSPTQHRPELVLLDYDLGDHTGADFLYWLRLTKRLNSTPVVMLSGSVGKPHIGECYASGANYFLRKPKTLARLKIIIRALHAGIIAGQRPDPICSLLEFLPDPKKHLIGAHAC